MYLTREENRRNQNHSKDNKQLVVTEVRNRQKVEGSTKKTIKEKIATSLPK